MKIRQVVVTGKNQVELQNLELNENDLGAEEILVETERTVISAGTELANYIAADPSVYTRGAWNAYPWKSGYGNVGIVRAAGEKVSRAKIGQRVFNFGPHASHHRYNAQTRMVVPLPDDLPLDEAAAARMAHVALTALDVDQEHYTATPRYNRWVAVFGLGLVGNLAAQMFQIKGDRVIGVDPAGKRRALARECGIQYFAHGNDGEIAAQIREITGGKMAQVSVDAVGHASVCASCLSITAPYGQLIILGSPRVAIQGDMTHAFRDAHLRWITIQGALEWRLPPYHQMDNEHSQLKKHLTIVDWIRDDKLKLKPLISHVLSPSEIKKAYDGLLQEKDIYVGVVLDWTKQFDL